MRLLLSVKTFGGLLEYKPQWTLTLQGWLCLLVLLVSAISLFMAYIHPFLAIYRPLEAEVLVVEGWIPDKAIKGAIAEFERKNYQLMLTTGPQLAKGQYLYHHKTHAELAAATMIALGLNPQQVVAVPAPLVKIDRTAASAVAVKEWLDQANLGVKTLNLYSYDVHTRRSWLIFRRILSTEIAVGAIAYSSVYDQSHFWWTESASVRSVISEAIAYCYARLFWKI